MSVNHQKSKAGQQKIFLVTCESIQKVLDYLGTLQENRDITQSSVKRQSISPSDSQSVSQPGSQPVSQSVSQSVCLSVCLSVSQSVSQSDRHTVS